jgi:hypothetical protein
MPPIGAGGVGFIAGGALLIGVVTVGLTTGSYPPGRGAPVLGVDAVFGMAGEPRVPGTGAGVVGAIAVELGGIEVDGEFGLRDCC